MQWWTPKAMLPLSLKKPATSQEAPAKYHHKSRGSRVTRRQPFDLKIQIQVAFTSKSIPADEEHIPTKAIAKNWEHLQTIEGNMHDLFDCNVGMLTGFDCP